MQCWEALNTAVKLKKEMYMFSNIVHAKAFNVATAKDKLKCLCKQTFHYLMKDLNITLLTL